MKAFLRFVLTVLTLAMLAALIPAPRSTRAAGPWYVAPGGSDSNDCNDPLTSCAAINGALSKPGFVAGDTILVASGVYTGTGTEVVLLNKSVTLSGGWDASFTVQGGASTIDGEGARRGIYVNSGVVITVEHFVIENGFSDWGGGICNAGTLTINISDIRNNQGGGVYTFGVLTLNNSSVVNNTGRGGIYKDGGTLVLNNSTISSNAGNSCGGVCNGNPGLISINSSTISRNSAYSGSGGGIENYYPGLITLRNTILAGNTPSDCQDQLTLAGYNILGSSAGCTYLITSATDFVNLDPELGSLMVSPAYHPVLLASPAINAGDPTGCKDHLGNLLTTDQRGATRVGRCDIGAYEYTTPGPADTVYAFAGTPQRAQPFGVFGVPLQAAVLDSIGSPVNDSTVTFFAPTSGASGTFSDTGSFTTTAVTNESGIATAATFTANGVAGSYVVTATVSGVITQASFSLSNLLWYVTTDGNDNDNCLSPATACATINGVLNKAGFVAGDTILVASGVYTGTATEVALLNKSVTLSGGWDAGFTIQSGTSTIDGEGARRGIRVAMYVTATVERFVIQNCILLLGEMGGGGIYNVGTLTLNNCTVRNNTAYGGGIYTEGGILALNDCTVSNNSSYGIGVFGSTLTVTNSTINENSGHGISIEVGRVTVNNSTIKGNMASRGGGIDINSYGIVTLNNSTISGNTALNGGGIYVPYDWRTSITLNSNTVSGNMASNSGGGIYAESNVQITLQNTILAGNTAAYSPDCYGYIGSAGYNLVGDPSGCIFNMFNRATGGLTNIDPKLGPLQNNGGSTPTHALLSGSPAINAGNPAGCMGSVGLLTADQRGASRMGRCDIGAYEYGGTITFLSSSPNPSIVGETVIFTATVVEGELITPTGSIDFYDDGILLGAGTLIPSGEATFSTSTLPAGTHGITATYTGDGNFGASTGTLSPNQQVNKASTTTTLVSSPNPSVYGQAITFTATVTSTVGTPTGSVDFYDDGVLLGAGTLNSSGEATFSTSALPVGTHGITATYTDDSNYVISTGRLSSDQVVIFQGYLPLVIR